MKHVLLAIDKNKDRSISQAETVLDLFDETDLTAHLLHVFTDNPEGASVHQVSAVKRAAEILEEANMPVEYHESSADPAQTIVEMAEDLDVNAICIGGRKRSPAGKALFGSVSQSVILETDRPTLVCKGKSDL